jgi:hypothetical protein
MKVIRDKIFEITLWADNTQELDARVHQAHHYILIDLAYGKFSVKGARIYFEPCCKAMADHWEKQFKTKVSKRERELLQIHYLTEFYRIIAEKTWGDLDQKALDLLVQVPPSVLRKLPIE